MIVVQLIGGLGNQMFQYAFGLGLVKKLKTEMAYDYIQRRADIKREFELNVFDIRASTAKSNGLGGYYIPRHPITFRLEGLARKYIPGFNSKVIREKPGGFDNRYGDFQDNSYYMGFWHSYKYFEAVEKQVRAEFRLKKPLAGQNWQLSKQTTQNPKSVAVHIRRGDYAHHQRTREYHGLLGIDYYEMAIELMQQKVGGKLKFFVFSDEIQWVKNNIKSLRKSEFVDWNTGNDSYLDMVLMSKCSHAIIANSSFSWWGAWLIEGKDKTVIVPNRWFSHDTAKDMHPPSWMRI